MFQPSSVLDPIQSLFNGLMAITSRTSQGTRGYRKLTRPRTVEPLESRVVLSTIGVRGHGIRHLSPAHESASTIRQELHPRISNNGTSPTQPTVVATLPVPVRAFGVSVNPNTNRLYVTAGDFSGLVVVFDTRSNTEITQIPVGDGPQGVAVNPVTNRIYVVNVRDQTVSVINGNTNSVIDTIPGFDFRPRYIDINTLTNRIYVGNEGNGGGTTLAVINGSTDKIIQNVPVGFGPAGIAVNPVTNRIYTANGGSNTVSVVDGTTNSTVASIPVGQRPLGVAVDVVLNRIYALNVNENSVSVIDGNTNAVIDTIKVGQFPLGISADSISHRVFVTNQVDNTFSVIDGMSDMVVATIGVGLGPNPIAFNPITNTAYVANDQGASVSVISLGTPPAMNLPTVVRLQRIGVHTQPTRFILTFNEAMDRTTAENLANYSLVLVRSSSNRDHHRVVSVPLALAHYDPVSQSVTLLPSRLLPLRRTYVLTVVGTPPNGLTSTAGLLLDGAGTGQQGSNYIARITPKLLVRSTRLLDGERAVNAHGSVGR